MLIYIFVNCTAYNLQYTEVYWWQYKWNRTS